MNSPNSEHWPGRKFHHPIPLSTSLHVTVECIWWPISTYPVSIISCQLEPMAILFSIDRMHSTVHASWLVPQHQLHSVGLVAVDFLSLAQNKFCNRLVYHAIVVIGILLTVRAELIIKFFIIIIERRRCTSFSSWHFYSFVLYTKR